MNLRPIADNIIVKRLPEETMTAGGLFIPEAAQEKPLWGEVVALGNAVAPDDLKVGDLILFAKYSGSEFSVDDDKILVIREEDVIGVQE